MTENSKKIGNHLFILERLRPGDWKTWIFAMELHFKQKYRVISNYFMTGIEEDFDMEDVDEVIEIYDKEAKVMTRTIQLKQKYQRTGGVEQYNDERKQKMRRKITYEDELKSATSILLQHIDRDLQTSLAIVQGYKKAYEENDVYKIKLMVKKLMTGQDRNTIYKDIATLIHLKPNKKVNEREQFFKDFEEYVDKLLNREDMSKEQILDCIINAIFIYGVLNLDSDELKEEIRKELMKETWDNYKTLITKWNDYCMTLDSMGWRNKDKDPDYIKANVSKMESNNAINALVTNELKRYSDKPYSKEDEKLWSIMVNVLRGKFVGNCWNCWAEDDHDKAHCPKPEVKCDDCGGNHNTKACKIIGKKSNRNFKRKVNRIPHKTMEICEQLMKPRK